MKCGDFTSVVDRVLDTSTLTFTCTFLINNSFNYFGVFKPTFECLISLRYYLEVLETVECQEKCVSGSDIRLVTINRFFEKPSILKQP